MSMRLERIEVFLLAYACLILCTVVALSSLMVSEIDVYVAAFVVEYFVAVLATAPHYPSEAKMERIMGAVLLVIFSEIVILHIIALLG